MMQLNIDPLRYALRKVLLQPSTLKEQAVRTWQIAPPGDCEVLPPLCLDGELDRVKKISRWSSEKTEHLRLFGSSISYPASEMIELTNASIIDNNVYKNGVREWQHEKAKFKLGYIGYFESYRQAFLCSSLHSNMFFGHWLTDQLSTELQAKNFVAAPITCMPSGTYLHASDYRNYLQLSAKKVTRANFKSLLLPINNGHNKSRQDSLIALRATIDSKLPKAEPAPLAYIRRGKTGAKRELVNEDEIIAWTKKIGGVVVDPEQSSVAEMHKLLGAAVCVLGVEGSAMTNAIMLMPADAALLIIQPPSRFHNILKTYTDIIGQRYGFVVADQSVDGFSQPLSSLEKLYEMVISSKTLH